MNVSAELIWEINLRMLFRTPGKSYHKQDFTGSMAQLLSATILLGDSRDTNMQGITIFHLSGVMLTARKHAMPHLQRLWCKIVLEPDKRSDASFSIAAFSCKRLWQSEIGLHSSRPGLLYTDAFAMHCRVPLHPPVKTAVLLHINGLFMATFQRVEDEMQQ